MYGPATIPSTGRYFLSVYSYRGFRIPIITMSALAGAVHWGPHQDHFAPWGVGPRVVEPFLRYRPDGRLLLSYDGAGLAHIFQPVDMEWSPDSSRVAVIFSSGIFHGGVVRVYDVATGKLQWERSFDFVEAGGEAWSPDGRRLALTLLTGQPNTAYPPRDLANLLVLDSESGQTLLAIRTGDLAGPVCFAPDNAVLTAPVHFLPQGHDRWNHEVVKVWDATTGKLIRRIASPGRDIHDRLELSRDGKVLLGYVGREHSGFVLRYLEFTYEVLDRKFQLFDYKTGDVIATSPDLTKGCQAGYDAPSFRMGPHGDRVLVYWPSSGCPPSVFEVSQTAEADR